MIVEKPERELLYNGFLKVEKDLPSGHEVVVATDSVGILIYDLKSGKVILTKQPRASMKGLINDQGMIIEIPAGRFDCNLGVKSLVIKEVEEETGIVVAPEKIELLNGSEPLALCPGTNTERMYLAAAEIDLSSVKQDVKIYGNAAEGEKIQRLVFPIVSFISMDHQDMKTWALANFLHAKMLQAALMKTE
jgi:8-oxo-dGTP pyrophosphatase MutT (NUDIX family)